MAEHGQAAVVDPIAGSPVYPAGSRIGADGHLEIAGCDVVELAAEFGTPAYVYAEDDMRARARAYREAFERRTDDFEVLFASKSFPCTAAYRLFAEEGLSVDVASGGELHMALLAGFDPTRIHMHGNNKSDEEILFAARAGVGHLIVDSFDEIERCERLLEGPQKVLIRVTPGIKPSTHDYVQTGQLDSKFGFGLEDGLAARAIERVLSSEVLELVGLHAHIGSQIFELEPYRLAIRAIGDLAGDWCRVVNVGGGLGIAYAAEDEPPSVDAYVDVKVRGVHDVFGEDVRVLVEPGRSLVGNSGVTIYRVGTVKEIPGVRTYVAVDGGMSDNMRPMLYGSRYEALIADRAGSPAETLVTIAGMHCESGDVLVRDAMLAEPAPGDVLVTPATGAYGYARASNYHGVTRPPVIVCRDGEARAVVRRETYEDLTSRDVDDAR
ncbi:MAG TPA: diaminopimelate decarboxylase [Solirubrobacterales bacterium]|nr:diaminopimelate decarboxylase [Solirubrobacterales bacterium]